MGLKLIKRAFATFGDVHLSGDARTVLLYMAMTARDDGDPPRYFARREETVYVLGRRVPDRLPATHPRAAEVDRQRAAAFQRLKVVTAELVAAGFLERVKRGQRNQRAEYAIRLPHPFDAGTDSLPHEGTDSLPRAGTEYVPQTVRNTYPQGDTGGTEDFTREEQPPVERASHLSDVDQGAA